MNRKASVPAPVGTKLVMPTAAEMERRASTNVANLTDVKALAERQLAIEDEIAKIVAQLDAANQRLNQIKLVDLPTAMDAAGVTKIELHHGIIVKVEDFITGNIREDQEREAFSWLRKHKFGSLIKNTIKVALGRGDDKKAKQLAVFLKKLKVPFERKEGVHVQTLRAFVREQLMSGKGLPSSIEVHRVPTATIIRPKE